MLVAILLAPAIVSVQPHKSAFSAPDAGATTKTFATATERPVAVHACDEAGFCWSHPSVPRVDLNAVWARAKNDVWIVGAAGTALHWDGRVWTQVETETTDDLVALHGAQDSNEVWALGSNGTLIRWDGSRWRHLWRAPGRKLSPDEAKLRPIDTLVPELAQHQAARAKTGDDINKRAGKGMQSGVELHDIWGPDFSHIWVVGGAVIDPFYEGEETNVALVRHFDGRAWSSQHEWAGRDRIVGRPLRSVFGTRADDVWVTSVGPGSRCPSWGDDSCLRPQHWNGRAWSPVTVLPEPAKLPVHVWNPGDGVAVLWKAARDTAWAVTSGSAADTVEMSRGPWRRGRAEAATRLSTRKGAAKDVRGTSDDDVWVVGKGGLIFHWDGSRWTGSTNEGEDETLNAVWSPSKGQACVAGERGKVMCWSGQSWSTLPPPTPERLLSIWGRQADDLWVVGDKGQAFRWQGKRWTAINTGTAESLTWVRGTADAVWIFGNRGAVLRVDGGGVKAVSNSGLHGRPKAILGGVGEDLFVYGPPFVRVRDGAVMPVPKDLSDLVRRAADVQAIAGSPALGLWIYGNQKILGLDGGAKSDGADVIGTYQLWVGAKDDVWAAPMPGAPAFLHREGGRWKRSVAHLPSDVAIVALSGDGENLWAVGTKGMILRHQTPPTRP
jgi:hypothetical protein